MGGLSPQQFCLKWNHHHSNLVTVFEELLSREAFVDVTLVCEGVSTKAHKMVLSACSPFFQALFAENPCQHPVVIMNQTRQADLRAVVEFMYKGEINVAQDQLPTLLQTAELLKVKGLAEVTANECPVLAVDSPPHAARTKVSDRAPHAPSHHSSSSQQQHPSPETPISSQRALPSHSSPQHSSPHTPSTHSSSKRRHREPRAASHSEEELSPSSPSQDAVAIFEPDLTVQPQTPPTSKTRSLSKQPAPANRRTFDHSYSDDKTNWVPHESDPSSLTMPPRPSVRLPLPAIAPTEKPEPPDYGTMESSSDNSQGAGTLFDESTVCCVCQRVFSTKGNLKRHMLMHRPYRHKHQCTMCLKMFSWPGDLRTHLRVTHGQGRHDRHMRMELALP